MSKTFQTSDAAQPQEILGVGEHDCHNWAAYYAAKQESERKHGSIEGWARPERHPFWSIAAQMNAKVAR